MLGKLHHWFSCNGSQTQNLFNSTLPPLPLVEVYNVAKGTLLVARIRGSVGAILELWTNTPCC